MTNKTHIGSCHCGRVQYQVELDLQKGTGKCNCSYCWKARSWGAIVKPSAFRLLAGEDVLSDYQFGTKSGVYRFCKHCGIRAFGQGELEMLGGAFVTINLACLDDLPAAELVEAPVHYSNGADNAWQDTPAEIRHL